MENKRSEKGMENGEWRIKIPHSSFSIPHSPQSRGATLLELLIYVAVLAGLMVIISNLFITLSKGRAQAEARGEVNAAARFVIEKIRQDAKGATSVTAPILGTASSTLSVVVGGSTVAYTVSGGQLFRKVGAAAGTVVTGTGVFVGTPVFTRLENYNTVTSATTTSIQATMTVAYNASSTDWRYSKSILTTMSLR